MPELSKSPRELFEENIDNVIVETVNGIKVPILKLSDSRGDYFAIPAIDKRLSFKAGNMFLGKWIQAVFYDTYNNEVAIIKVYYTFK
ncbi:hypothetical protein [Clostridium baratii]|uniref:hypothetical protein n=1 Tax=Clostridium baratii TaxID=1561 RepID=UPI0030D10F9B